MEYTDYYVAKGSPDAIRDRLSKQADKALLVDDQGELVPFVACGTKKGFEREWDWLLRVFDAEGSAWGFELHVDGVEIGSATYGENAEWGIDPSDNGFEGDLDAVAKALGTSKEKLEACLHDGGAEAFCKAVGFDHQYMLYPHEDELPDGIVVLSEMG